MIRLFLESSFCLPLPALTCKQAKVAKQKKDSRNNLIMPNFPIRATSPVGPNGKSCDGTEPEKPCTGVVTLVQDNADSITISWDIKNLGEPGSKHGFHVHEKADFSNGCKSAGPHWN